MYPYRNYYPVWNEPINHHYYIGGENYWEPTYRMPPNNMNVSADYGKQPYVVNIEEAAERNRAFRRALWTGNHLQVTLMSINPGEDIGLEIHPHTDQFLRIEEGRGLVQMGPRRNQLNFRRRVGEDDAIMVPAGTWHNLTNTGNQPLKLYSIYAPPEHPFGTLQQTRNY